MLIKLLQFLVEGVQEEITAPITFLYYKFMTFEQYLRTRDLQTENIFVWSNTSNVLSNSGKERNISADLMANTVALKINIHLGLFL